MFSFSFLKANNCKHLHGLPKFSEQHGYIHVWVEVDQLDKCKHCLYLCSKQFVCQLNHDIWSC